MMTSPSNTIKLVSMTQNTLAKTLTTFEGGRKLLFSQGGQYFAFQPKNNLNSKLEDEEHQDEKMQEEEEV